MIFDDLVPNSSPYRGVLLVAIKNGSNLEQLLEQIGIPAKYSNRFKKFNIVKDYWSVDDYPYEEIEFDDLTDNYWILEARVYWEDATDNELSGFIQLMSGTKEREKLVDDDLILLFCNIKDSEEERRERKNASLM